MTTIPQGYEAFLHEMKDRINHARIRASVSVNRELVLLYWRIGRDILARQEEEGWGAKIIGRLAQDLQRAFPDMKGFSERNLKYMRGFAEAYPEEAIVQEVLAQISWYQNIGLMEKLRDQQERLWYARKSIENGWSRNVLVHQIELDLYHRQGRAITNFDQTLPPPQSDMANELIKDPYTFDFLAMGDELAERGIEKELVDHVKEFLMELGKGFAFVGSQYPLEVGDQDFWLDLLFYHLHLRCFVVIDLKVEKFKPEFAGKMNFYLSAVDDLLRHPTDHPSIGLILCKDRNRVIVEYSLRDTAKPLAVATYHRLPADYREALPTPEELEAEFGE
ncbi:MAG: DUF1016 family protein [Candidatus Omnitrophica bacterium]|nr:DUF1016 family protein [Candidatus Omnitrophota bacterium]MCA9439588.1 DUF1016 family protein [Candidatus Omnitrophota bacterium]